MDFSKIIQTIEDGVDVIEKLAPVATAIGGPIVGKLFKTVETVSEIAHNVIDRAAEAGEVFSTDDQAKIQSSIARLAAQNDKLAEAIQNS
jgi:hypothetical protein